MVMPTQLLPSSLSKSQTVIGQTLNTDKKVQISSPFVSFTIYDCNLRAAKKNPCRSLHCSPPKVMTFSGPCDPCALHMILVLMMIALAIGTRTPSKSNPSSIEWSCLSVVINDQTTFQSIFRHTIQTNQAQGWRKHALPLQLSSTLSDLFW